MIGRRSTRNDDVQNVEPKGFDDFQLRLGDMMRGERATMGKSLLDVERELRIKAAYISAIEDSNPDAFDTPGFIPGYVRSYARYLGMDPDQSFKDFCEESGFSIAHGMSAEASTIRKSTGVLAKSARVDDPLFGQAPAYMQGNDGFFSRIEPGAIGSILVLAALIGGIGYGGWAVLNEVQRVQFAPVENAPDVLADLDPLAGNGQVFEEDPQLAENGAIFRAPNADKLDRLYRPEALDVPVLVARDAPISTLDPRQVGTLRPELPKADTASVAKNVTANPHEAPAIPSPQVVGKPLPGLQMVAVRPSWVRVRAADGSIVYETVMKAGESYVVPATEEAQIARIGESGAVYFQVDGKLYGPAGNSGSVTSNLKLDADSITGAYQYAAPEQDDDLFKYVAELNTAPAVEETPEE
ncbi:hypothetical protein ROA7450_00392 [Roseovarius albus]|uniref:Cytoskeleton protein RodZ-like C-terminal domain-containing protein n=1 Tax=Roseovarius albus TaxID=1247867 RepID=A0A1X6YBE4_9RHOB|nr:RodZ domain-containing protein [Roseovarius albus]SLN15981.1 hypothetical protein ROA7450_00392 [Roseovarius albus]